MHLVSYLVKKSLVLKHYDLICSSYKDGNSTNMAVMEVELPSGYNADVDALPAATRAKEVKRVDTTNNDGTVFVYFDRVCQFYFVKFLRIC